MKLETHENYQTTSRGTNDNEYQIYLACADNGKVWLDSKYWDYSVTTGKYRNQFLGETKKETQAKIDSGEYILTNLN